MKSITFLEAWKHAFPYASGAVIGASVIYGITLIAMAAAEDKPQTIVFKKK